MTPGGGLAVPFSCRLASAGPCDLRVRTLFYDARGARLPQVDEQSVVPPAGAPRRLTLSLRVPAGAASARPGWWVRGLTGRLEVTREA